MKFSRAEWFLIAIVFALGVAANLPDRLQALVPVTPSGLQIAALLLLVYVLVRHVPLPVVLALSMLLVGAHVPQLLAEHYRVDPWVFLLLFALLLVVALGYQAMHYSDNEPGTAAGSGLSQNVQMLFRVVERGNLAWAQRLIAMGADVNVRNEVGQTPLMYAAEKGYADMVQVLLQNGANPRLENNQGESALTIALIKGYTRIAESLEMAEASHRYRSPEGGDRS